MIILFVCVYLYGSNLVLVEGANSEYHRVCVIDDQSQYRPDQGQFSPRDLSDVTMCTHLVYNYAWVDDNGTGVEVSDNYQVISAFKADNADLKTLLGLGGPRGSGGFHVAVNSTNTLGLFMEALMQYVRDGNFDGVVIDWAQTDQGDDTRGNVEGFDLLLFEMATAFEQEAASTGRERLLVGVAMPGDRDSIDIFYPLQSIATYADMILVKGYDLYTPGIPLIGHQSSLFSRKEEDGYLATLNVDFTVRYLIYSGIPASKLILGIPTHGRSQTFYNQSQQYFGADAAGPGRPGSYSQTSGHLAYFEICQLINVGELIESFHEGHQVPFAFNDDEIVTYDNKESIRLKINYVKDSQLGGVFVSSLDDDDFKGGFCNQGPFPLTNSLRGYIERSRDNCYPGEFGGLDVAGCSPCPLGTYQPDSHRTGCVSCPNGQTTLTRGSTDPHHCVVDCPSGSEYSFFEKQCTECPLGFHRRVSEHAHCEKCPQGKTTVARASTQCVDQPDSVQEMEMDRVDVDATLLFHVTSCDNKPVILGIILQLVKEFVLDLASTWTQLCSTECSNVHFHRVKECAPSERQKRSTGPSSAGNMEVTMTLSNVTEDIQNSQHSRRVDKVLAEALDEKTVFSPLDGYGVQYLGLADLRTTVVCDNGSEVINGIACSPCAVGTFHNVTSSACQPCPVGTYQDVVAMTSCKPCGGVKTTTASGSTLASHCISPCQAKPRYCYNNGVCHWHEGDPASIYCQCTDGYVGDRCADTKEYYLDNGAIVGISIGAVSALLLLGLIIASCVVCLRCNRSKHRSVEIKRTEKLSSPPGSPCVTSVSSRISAPLTTKGSQLLDYLDYYTWWPAGQPLGYHQDLYQQNSQQQLQQQQQQKQQQQQLHRPQSQSPRRVLRHRSMPLTSDPNMAYAMTLTPTSGRENSTLPRIASRHNTFKSVHGEY